MGDDDVIIQTEPGGGPQTPPSPTPEDPKLKDLMANLAKRLDTMNATVLDGNTKAEAQRADIKKLAALIMEDTSIGFEDFKKKIVAENIPNKLETPMRSFGDMVSLFVPDICGDIGELLGLKREADKVHDGKEKTGV